ncbi:MAG: alpha/beta hydrolase [Geminicoccaceae bacterium]|nr:alpha/beta hydrolase [Geminicoccaceae bacterium]
MNLHTGDDEHRLAPGMARSMAEEARLDREFGRGEGIAESRRAGPLTASFWNEGLVEAGITEELHTAADDGHTVPLRLFRGAKGRPSPVILYIYGGGWVAGSVVQNEPAIRTLVHDSGWSVVAPTYRLAPEHPFPAGLTDCTAALAWIRESGPGLGLDPARIVLAGTSAGGNLAAATALADNQRAGLAGLMLFYGVLAVNFDSPSYREFADGRFGLPRARMMEYFDHYDPGGRRVHDPLVTPMLGDLAGLPPTWLVAAELDVLRDDTLSMARRLESAGVRTQLRVEKGVTHGFINRARVLPAARSVLADAVRFLEGLER